MSDVIQLVEHQPQAVALAADDVAFISQQLAKHFVIRRDLTGSQYWLNPQQYVGVVALPSGRRLECRPKVPVQSVFLMLAQVYGLEPMFQDEEVGFATLDELIELLVARFAALVEDRIDQGVYRSYVEREDNLTAVRGRVLIAADLRQNVATRHRTYCRFTDFTVDVPENQIIREVAYRLRHWVRSPALRWRLEHLDHQLHEVSPVRHPERLLATFVYSRLSAAYAPIHRLCALFLAGWSLGEDAGEVNERAFLIDMNSVFEQFVTAVLRERAPGDMLVASQVHDVLDWGGRVAIRPDLVISRRGRPVLVADCKYKRHHNEHARPADVYQVLAYCVGQRVQRGLLIYPQHEAVPPGAGVIAIRHQAVRIKLVAVDLARPPAEFTRACDQLAAAVWQWVPPAVDTLTGPMLAAD